MAAENLQNLGIVRELTAQKRNRIFSYKRYLDILNIIVLQNLEE